MDEYARKETPFLGIAWVVDEKVNRSQYPSANRRAQLYESLS